MVDSALQADAATDEKTAFLFALLAHDPIHRYWFTDDPLPEDLEYRDVAGELLPRDWIKIISPSNDSTRMTVGYLSDGRGHFTSADIDDDRLSLSDTIDKPVEYEDNPDFRAAMKLDIQAMLIAEAIGCHLYITDRPTLHFNQAPPPNALAILRPEDALPLVGLYLRLQGIHVLPHSSVHRLSVGRKDTYEIAIFALIPELQRWILGLKERYNATTDANPLELLQSMLRRLVRVVESRDRIFGLLSIPQDADVAEDLLALVDQCLLWAIGAIDVLSLLVDATTPLNTTNKKNVGWNKTPWIDNVRALQHPIGLAAQCNANSKIFTLISILGPLRNTIHDQALLEHAHKLPNDSHTTYIAIPPDRAASIRAVIPDQNVVAAWGIDDLPNGLTVLNPTTFVEQLVPELLETINGMFAVFSDEDIASHPWTYQAPPETLPFEPRIQNRVLWQLGLA